VAIALDAGGLDKHADMSMPDGRRASPRRLLCD